MTPHLAQTLLTITAMPKQTEKFDLTLNPTGSANFYRVSGLWYHWNEPEDPFEFDIETVTGPYSANEVDNLNINHPDCKQALIDFMGHLEAEPVFTRVVQDHLEWLWNGRSCRSEHVTDYGQDVDEGEMAVNEKRSW